VNIGSLQPLAADRPGTRTGIHKAPVAGAIALHALGLAGDHVGNTRHHGGADQAVYLYSAEDYAWWSEQLGTACAPGLFGENLTIEAWWPDARIGDRLHIGEVTLELTAPRIPCGTLAARMGDPQFVTRFLHAARPGAYARVLEPGAVEADGVARVARTAGTHVTVADALALWHRPPRDREALQQALAAPLASRLRATFAKWSRAERRPASG
jgi:MOSC domain-containing protein YiiM